LIQQDKPFYLLVAGIRNLKQLDGRCSRTVIEGALKAVLIRFHNLAGEEAMIGPWSEEEFVAILSM
jgi:GGDEF domain-containing protein